MGSILGLIVATALTALGLCKIIWPGLLLDREPDRPQGPPTAQQLSESRWQAIVMLAIGIVGLYAILSWDGTPAEFIGV